MKSEGARVSTTRDYRHDVLHCLAHGSVGFFFFSSRRRHTRCSRDWSSDVCSSDLYLIPRDVAADAGAYIRFPFEALLAAIAQESVANQCIVIEIGRASCRERV